MDRDSPIINCGGETLGNNRRDGVRRDKKGVEHEGMGELEQNGGEESEEEVFSVDGRDGVGHRDGTEEGEKYWLIRCSILE